jgi:hypothetical protein
MDIIGLLYLARDGLTYFIYFHYDKIKEVEYYIIKYKSKVLAKFKLFQISY